MQAQLMPKIIRAGSEAQPCEMLARTGGDKIKVQVGRLIFAVHRWRLHSADNRRRVAPEEFDALPWQGAGTDPKAAAPRLGLQPLMHQ